jgi:hypothetical protein
MPMNKIKYDKDTSLTSFMDQYTVQRLERTIYFEKNCTPSNTELIDACEKVIKHIKSVWSWGQK